MTKINNIRKAVGISIIFCAGFSIAILALNKAPTPPGSSVRETAQYISEDESSSVILMGLIESAETEIFIQANTLSNRAVISLLREKSKEGLRIQFLLSATENPDLRNPKYLIGWLLSNRIGEVSVADREFQQGIIAIDKEKIFAFQGVLDGDNPAGIIYAPSNSAFYDSLKKGITDAFSVSRQIKL